MENECEAARGFIPSPKFSKTSREWILASALYDGIEDEDIRQIEMLLSERGANPNVLLPEYGITPFHLVVANESTRFAVLATDLCLQHGADPNVRSEDGLTPVHLAAMWGCTEVLHVLLASGGNPWLVDALNFNAFDYATKEKQHECYKILKMYCNSQPKPSGCSKSPYQLNLKRVILYKNDLQIVYEASPTDFQKCASTQTSPNFQKQTKTKADKGVMNEVFDKSNRISSAEQNVKYPSKNCNEFNSENIHQSTPNSSRKHKDKVIVQVNKQNKECNFEQGNQENISSKLREIIEKHRRNSTIFEYPQLDEEKNSSSSGVNSWNQIESSDIVMSTFSELVNKLEHTNTIRQSLKSKNNSSGILKHVTQRKKTPAANQPNHSSVCEKSTPNDGSCQSEVPQHEVGFILNDSTPHSSVFYSYKENPIVESPPSIGFILDNAVDSFNETRGSSLFSDIASDVEVVSTPVQNDNDNIMTEDEKSSCERNLTQVSSTDSLYPYVSCENTRERESSEDFASCSNVKSNNLTSDQVNAAESTPKKLSVSVLEEIISNFRERGSKTPVNPDLITSTPERSEGGSEEVSFVSALGDHQQNSSQTEMDKRKWVEAKVVSSSSEEEPYMSISEEYEYTDMDEGVVLIEKRYLPKDISLSPTSKVKKSIEVQSSSSECETVSTISGSEGAYDTDELRRALCQHGFIPGPITSNTKRIYLRKLKRCRSRPLPPPPPPGQPAYSPELLKTMSSSCEHLLAEWSHLEDSMAASFTCTRRPWREGQAKTSFTYLLLDPRLSHNLPASANTIPHNRLWADFLRAIFYVGKGKRSRPYAHLYKAVALWQQKNNVSCKKIQRILDIWKSGQGVICLHIFLNVIPVEAFTREAAMISALTLSQLTNEKMGEFYGSAASWSLRLKRRLGCVLLHRAFKVYLAEGERQLRPADID